MIGIDGWSQGLDDDDDDDIYTHSQIYIRIPVYNFLENV